MISDRNTLINVKKLKICPKIRLPNGKTSMVTHTGDFVLKNSLLLKDVACVPDFRHNLLSISKLVKDGKHNVIFYPDFCIIQDCHSKTIKGVGKAVNGLYYLVNVSLEELKKACNQSG